MPKVSNKNLALICSHFIGSINIPSEIYKSASHVDHFKLQFKKAMTTDSSP